MHPHSVLSKFEQKFELPSILHITSKDGLRGHNSPPLFDDRYLVIFDDVKTFENNVGFLHLNFMFPIVFLRNRVSLDSAKAICQEKSLPYSIYVNEFKKEDAYDLIRELATEIVSDNFCKALVRKTGLSPQRIVSAITVCEQVGYQTTNIDKYVDKHVYVDMYDLIEVLLGECKSAAQRRRACLYVHMNRLWFNKHTRTVLLKEMKQLVQLYTDWLNGVVTSYNLQEYVEQAKVSRYRVLYARELLGKVSLTQLLSLQVFLTNASILEVALRLA